MKSNRWMPQSFLEGRTKLTGGNNGTNRGARIGEKTIQTLPHLGLTHICSQRQTDTEEGACS